MYSNASPYSGALRLLWNLPPLKQITRNPTILQTKSVKLITCINCKLPLSLLWSPGMSNISKLHKNCQQKFLSLCSTFFSKYVAYNTAQSDWIISFHECFKNLFLFRVLLLQSCLRAHYFEPLKKMFGAWNPGYDTNVHKIFSALNLTIIFIKPFTCILMQPLSFFNEILYLH